MIFIINIFILYNLKLIKGFSIDEYLNNTYNYRKELCSYNGNPIFNVTTNEVTCECDPKFTDEPNKKRMKYINGHLIHCSYRRKSRIMVVFISLCFPLGFEYLYLERYIVFTIVFSLSLLVISLNSIVFIINYQVNMKSKNTIIQNKMNKLINKKENEVIIKDNKCIKRLYIIAKITAVNHILYMILDILAHALGYITDYYHIETENDFGYLFEKGN